MNRASQVTNLALSSNMASRRFFVTGLYKNKEKIRRTKSCTGFNIIDTSDVSLVERFGKFHRTLNPGLSFTIPIVERMHVVSMREFAIEIAPQSTVTKDNVQVDTSGAVYFKVVDPYKACYETYDLMTSVITHSQSALRAAIGTIDLDTLFHDRGTLNLKIKESLSEAAAKWGVEINRYEITDVSPDKAVSAAMDSQSIAERKKREVTLQAEGKRTADITISEGKKMSVINEAEAKKREQVLAAEAIAEALLLKAKAEADSMNLVGQALRDNPEAREFILAKEYMNNVAKMLPKSTVFIPQDINDINKLVATATSITGVVSTASTINKHESLTKKE